MHGGVQLLADNLVLTEPPIGPVPPVRVVLIGYNNDHRTLIVGG